MGKEVSNRINYTVMCISSFANRHSLSLQKSYTYLKQYGGLSFLKDCYDAEHLLSIDDAIDDLTMLCRRNGGAIA